MFIGLLVVVIDVIDEAAFVVSAVVLSKIVALLLK